MVVFVPVIILIKLCQEGCFLINCLNKTLTCDQILCIFEKLLIVQIHNILRHKVPDNNTGASLITFY